ncbi:hypothetical protein M406DRAFT_273191 [Cryphonectria parasitica EP155]|uniref:Pre-rRNA-processing protein n=1 Tax=Cryphonectria parasitica (strain ATCC 38755 / EP155) TaxID=660469 RepID=A0A9P4Y9B4_CRYP1|nr:uncharacterized protein M406DRAFT_273191 [Cryphonectria parasitica EP155]KAF3768717.1 hypothetical protein M406DRAFT_273191 [Cryphonectria parasitica EP155]
MGSSTRKKKEKKKDFQKAKLKVGKTKAKASNFTDTSFQSKAIVVNQQSLSTVAPDAVAQFRHNFSLATSRADKQRREALSHLVTQLTSTPPNNPVGTYALLDKLLPLITDISGGVRTTLLRLFQALPAQEIAPHADKAAKWVRLGMLHLSAEVRHDALKFMEWLLDAAGEPLLETAGGWTKMLEAFAAMMGWKNAAAAAAAASADKNWTSAPKTTFGADKGGSSYAGQIAVLTKFVALGLKQPPPVQALSEDEYWEHVYGLPKGPDPLGYLSLFGPPQDGEICADVEERQRVFCRWMDTIQQKVGEARREGGPAGRAAGELMNVIEEGMDGYEHIEMEEMMVW